MSTTRASFGNSSSALYRRHSKLDQITTSNVSKLQTVWSFHTGDDGDGLTSIPIVIDGLMYLSTPTNQVFALDARTGDPLWHYIYSPRPNHVKPGSQGSFVQNRGVAVYRESCATGYCHGVNGSMAGAPRLVARGFDVAHIRTSISEGVKDTSMPGFASALPQQDLLAVMTYVADLNDIRNPVFAPSGGLGIAAASQLPALSEQGERGRALFIDADKGVQRCSSCHELEGLGIAVAGPLSEVPGSVAALRVLQTPAEQRISHAGETMPGLMVANGVTALLFYDLTVAPPVLRTLPAGTAVETGESDWSHAEFMRAYSEQELGAVLEYLQAVVP